MSGPPETGPPDLELHGAKTGNCLRAAIGLSEAGLTYRIRHLDLRRGDQRDRAHLALNPEEKVPVLESPPVHYFMASIYRSPRLRARHSQGG
jgi:glutathione S-transferase